MKAPILLSFVIGALFLAFNNNSSFEKDSQQVKALYEKALLDGECYNDLEYLATKIGGRLSGSPQAAAAVEWARQTLLTVDVDTVYLQECMVPHWYRGDKEEARIISDMIGHKDIPICALGSSVGTGPVGMTAEVVEVEHVDDIKNLNPATTKGKIVYINNPMDQSHYDTFHAYGECTGGRYNGAAEAARKGAVAVVIRSIASSEDDLPHTGSMGYQDDVKKIPAAALSTKASTYLSALLKEDPKAKLHIKMNCEQRPDALSYNVIAEMKGTDYPDEIILVGGHLDSWDLAQGAHDDGAGTVHAIETLRMFKEMDIRPKRTVRCVLFMNEENGQRGATKYAKVAKENNEKHIVAIESDRGGFAPRGWKVDHEKETMITATINQIDGWLEHQKAYGVYDVESGFSGVDIKHLKDQGTVCLGFFPDPQRYFDYHHSPDDNFDKVNKRELELGAGTIASLVYLFSEHGVVPEVGIKD